jgi:acyl carrier protein
MFRLAMMDSRLSHRDELSITAENIKYEERNRMGYDIIDTVRQFFVDRAWLTDEDRVLESESLLEKGVIDSGAMVELVTFIEQTFEVHIDDEELMPENFDSLAAIGAFLISKQNGGR